MIATMQVATENAKMDRLVGTLEGRRVVVVANGPSLLGQDLRWLADEVTIGVNRAHLLPLYNHDLPRDWCPTFAAWIDHHKVDFPPTVYTRCEATFVYRQELERTTGIPKEWPNLVPFDALTFNRERPRYLWRSRYEGGLVQLGSTTISSVHAAFVMGAEEVWVIGCDHRHDDEGRSHFYSPVGADLIQNAQQQRKTWQTTVESWGCVARSWPGAVTDKGPWGGMGESYGP